MLGCKAGLIFIVFGNFTIYLWLYLTPVPSPWHVPFIFPMKITYTFYWPIPHVHLLWAMHLPVAGPWDPRKPTEWPSSAKTHLSTHFFGLIFAHAGCFFYWAMWANPASLGYNQSQRSWGKGLVAFIDDMLKSFSYRTISCLSKTCVSYPRLVMNWPWAWLVLVKLPEIAVIRQGSNLIQFRFRRIAPLPPYYSQIIPTLNLDNQLGVSKWRLPQITS